MSELTKPKTMTVDEFWKSGFLQEVNRQFLHPAGIALSVTVDKETGEATGFGPVWDYRDDPEGLVNANGFSRAKSLEYQRLFNDKQETREARRGYIVQPCEEP